jgi:hypothetical protein
MIKDSIGTKTEYIGFRMFFGNLINSFLEALEKPEKKVFTSGGMELAFKVSLRITFC